MKGLTVKSMRPTTEGILLEGSRGGVLLEKAQGAITAMPLGLRARKNKNYAEQLGSEAIRQARNYRTPWTHRPDGSMQIHDPKAFYQASFDPTLRSLEQIQMWLQQLGKTNAALPPFLENQKRSQRR